MAKSLDTYVTQEEIWDAVSIKTICKEADVSAQYAYKLVKKGGFRPIKIQGNELFYHNDALEYVRDNAKPRKSAQPSHVLPDLQTIETRLEALENAQLTHVLPEDFQIFQAQTQADIKQIREVIKQLHALIKKFE